MWGVSLRLMVATALACGIVPLGCGVCGLDEPDERNNSTLFRSAGYRGTAICARSIGDLTTSSRDYVKAWYHNFRSRCGYVLPSCDHAVELDAAERRSIIATLWIPRGRPVKCRIKTTWFCLKRPPTDGQVTPGVGSGCGALLPPSSPVFDVVFTDRIADVDGGIRELHTDLDTHPVFLSKRLAGFVPKILTVETRDVLAPNSRP